MKINDMLPLSVKKALRPLVVARRHRNLRQDDVFLASYPKSGNTWLKFMLSTLFSDADVGFDEAEELLPFVGNHTKKSLLPDGRRVLKTHEAYRRDYKKAIYLIRDGRDVAISYYHHHLRENAFKGDIERFVYAFLNGEIDGLPAWSIHVESWIEGKQVSDILFVKYEECLLEPLKVLNDILLFLKLNVEEAELLRAIEANTKDKMRDKEQKSLSAIGTYSKDIPFVRKGISGEWQEVFSPQLNEYFINIAGNTLENLGYKV